MLNKLLASIEKGSLFTKSMFLETNLDEALEGRDSPLFEENWLRISAALKGQEGELSNESRAILDEIRKASYLKVYGITKNPEVSGEVSDDFGLIGLGVCLNVKDPWLNGLWAEYKMGKFPSERIKEVEGGITIS